MLRFVHTFLTVVSLSDKDKHPLLIKIRLNKEQVGKTL